jgi:hypothetical protein
MFFPYIMTILGHVSNVLWNIYQSGMLQSLSIFSVLIYLNINKKKFYVPPTDKDSGFLLDLKILLYGQFSLKQCILS